MDNLHNVENRFISHTSKGEFSLDILNKLVSVIVPCYNVDKYIDDCLSSIVANLETYTNLEIICVNDASTDGTLAHLRQWSEKCKKITVLNQLVNGGLSSARNIGLLNSHGDYISFVDSDDVIAPYFYEKMIQLSPPLPSCIIQCGLAEFDDGFVPEFDCSAIPRFTTSSVSETVTALPKYKMDAVLQCNKLFSRDIFFKADKTMRIMFPNGLLHEDEHIIASELTNAKRMVVTDAKLYGYRRNRAGSITNKFSFKRIKDTTQARLNAIGILETYRDVKCRTAIDFQNLAEAIEFEKTTMMNDFMYMYMKLSKTEKQSYESQKLFDDMKQLKKQYFPFTAKYNLFFASPKIFEIFAKQKNS